MTDLEINRLCAEAMGIRARLVPIRGTVMRYRFMDGNVEHEYNPLHDDAQAMALLYWLSFEAEVIISSGEFHCNSEEHCMENIYGISNQLDLNRAICECVATMQQAKEQA